AYDSARRRLVVFGGVSRDSGRDTFLGDTWEYDPAAKTWAQRAGEGAGPVARAYAAATFDSARGRVAVFGGRGANGPADAGTVWEWDGATWSPRSTTTPPASRDTAAMAFDAKNKVLVLFGGEVTSSSS